MIGASIAYHLAKKGISNIIVIDKSNIPGSESTSKATGGFRAQFGSEINIKLSLLSGNKLKSFKDETGIDPEIKQNGYLFIANNDNKLQILRSALELQHNCGLTEAEEVTTQDISRLNPYIKPDGILGGTFCGTDGFISPMQILKGYIDAAKSLGVKFEYGAELTGFTKTPNSIGEVLMSTDKISAGSVVNAAGAWAGKIAGFAGCEIPVTPLKRQVAVVKEEKMLPDNMPMTIFAEDSFHFRMRDNKLILLLPEEPVSRDIYNTNPEDIWMEKVFAIAQDRIPSLNKYNLDKQNSWAGLYEMSPDEHVLLGKASGFENFYLANGSSGHGVMHSPAIGELLSEIIVDGKASTLDVNSLNPSRFAEGKPIKSINIF